MGGTCAMEARAIRSVIGSQASYAAVRPMTTTRPATSARCHSAREPFVVHLHKPTAATMVSKYVAGRS